MYLGLPQIHVSAVDILANPIRLLELISEHRVQRTFAPNFFLAKLRREVEAKTAAGEKLDLNLECLEWLGSGGEASVTDIALPSSPCCSLPESGRTPSSRGSA